MSDLIIDFETLLKQGRVYLVEIDLELQDTPDDVPNSINADVYVVATSSDLAHFIASQLYPDYISLAVNETPITEYEYAARRNRSVL